jgi:hypothetical protein
MTCMLIWFASLGPVRKMSVFAKVCTVYQGQETISPSMVNGEMEAIREASEVRW